MSEAASIEQTRTKYKSGWCAPQVRAPNSKFLYLISEGQRGPVKIGVSISPENRLCSLQTGNSRKLRLARVWSFATHNGAQEAETFLLWNLSTIALEGEWLDLWEDDAIIQIEGHLVGLVG